METAVSQLSTQPSPGEQQSETRYHKTIEVVIKAVDKAGTSFVERTQTINISQSGARLLTKNQLAEGTRLQVAVPHLKRVSWATVAWLGPVLVDAQEIGIAIDDANDFWELEYPGEATSFGGPRSERVALADASLAFADPPDMLAKALRDLANAVVREALSEALQQLHQQTAALKDSMQQAVRTQAREQVHGALRAALSGVSGMDQPRGE